MAVVTALGIAALNHLISSESWAQDRMRQISGRRVSLELASALVIRVHVDDAGLLSADGSSEKTDVTLTLSPETLLTGLFDRSQFFASVRVQGAVDVAETLAFVLRNLRWDAEGDLARVVGDIAAHRIGMYGRQFADALQRALRNGVENAREYMVEEDNMLVSPVQANEFFCSVVQIRDDVARLEKRIALLSF